MEAIRRGVVLVVDDDPSMLATLERMVARAGFDVICCEDARTGLRICVDEQPDVVVTDLDMPHLDGVTLAARIAETLDDHAPPVIVLTGGYPERAEGARGVSAVVEKPISMEVLVELLARAVGETTDDAAP